MVFSSATEYTVTAQPLNLTVSFAKAIQSLDEAQLQLANCRVLSSLRYANNLFFFLLVPLAHGVFSFTVPAGAVVDLHGNVNAAATFTRYYAEGFLTTSLTALRPLYADLQVRYTYPATVACVLRDARATLNCSALMADPAAVSSAVEAEVPATLRLEPLQLNHTAYAYCCAVEANDVEMSNSVQSTELTLAVGWLDCPVVAGEVCSAHGTCDRGEACACDAGFYEAACDRACPGLMTVADGAKECSGHGTCRHGAYTCKWARG